MRTLPAILLVAFVAVLILASAALTTQFGVRDWPTPPSPDTTTRLVTPTEAAGRATEKVARNERNPDTDATAYSGTTRKRRAGAGRPRTGGTRRATPATPRKRRGGALEQRGGSSAQQPADDRPPMQETTPPEDPAAPVADADPVPDTSGDDTQARPQDQPADPAPTQPTTPVPGTGSGDGDEAGDDDGSGQRRGPIRNVLQNLLGTP